MAGHKCPLSIKRCLVYREGHFRGGNFGLLVGAKMVRWSPHNFVCNVAHSLLLGQR